MPPAETPTGSSRFDPSWLLLLAAALFLARVAVGVWETYHPPKKSEKISWVPFERAEALSRESGRPILYDFSAEWCAPCNAMKDDVFADKKNAKIVEQTVVPVRLVDRTREEGHNTAFVDSLQRAYAVDGFPTLVVYSPSTGRSQMTSGYGGPEVTLKWIARNAYAVRTGVGADGKPLP
jgi:thiol:disulfide interchange protein